MLKHLAFGFVMSVVAAQALAHADVTSAFKACSSYAVNANASASAYWPSGTPEQIAPKRKNGKLVCERSDWAPAANASVNGERISWYKVPIDGTSSSVLGFACYYDVAQALFEELDRFAYTHRSTWSDRSVVEARKVGSGLACYRRLRDGDGNETNYYWCIFQLDVSSDFVKALNL